MAVVRPYSYIFTIAFDHGRSSGRSACGTPSSSAMTATGSSSAIPVRTSTGSVPPERSTRPSTSSAASCSTHGRSRSTCPRANAVLISRRRRVWSGGSISRIALRWMRLKLPNRSPGSLSRQIRPSRRSRSTALASACVKASQRPRPSCHCTGAAARARANDGYGSATTAGSVRSSGVTAASVGAEAAHLRCWTWPPASDPPSLPPPRRRASTRRPRARAAPAAATSTATARATRRR